MIINSYRFGAAYDADALTFFNAGTFNDALKTAYNTFFLNLKTGLTNGTNVFSDTIALYILTSGNAADNAINAKNPGTFDLTFVNSPTHASTGVTFNGTTQYARTGLVESTALTIHDTTISIYMTTNKQEIRYAIGAQTSTTQETLMIPRTTTNLMFARMNTNSVGGSANFPNTDSSELLTLTRRSATDMQAYRNTTSLGTESNGNLGALPDVETYIGARNNAGSADLFTNNEFRIAMIGNGLTTAQVQDWSAAVTQLMTDLGL